MKKQKAQKSKIQALVELKVQPQKNTGYDAIAKRIYKYPQVITHYLLSGAYDFLVIVEGDTHEEIATFVFDKLATMEHINSTHTHFVFKKYKENGKPIDKDSELERMAIVA